jgi:serine/threonine protein kinase
MNSIPSQRDPFEQVVEAFLARYRAGERPAVSEYAQLHPEFAEQIRELFPALIMMEEHGPRADCPSETDHSFLGRQLGDFELVRELGRGGMGIVYEARQLSLKRKVALKVLSGLLGLTPRSVQRFRREAEAAAKLHHTNIVPVYATGEQGGTHYYAMEMIEGPSLDKILRHLRQNTTPPDKDAASGGGERLSADLAATGPYLGENQATPSLQTLSSSSLSSGGHYFDTVARMIADVADALEYANKNGVIHRDIKPSNLLLSPDGRLSINDFGLARVLEQPGMTMTGEFVGTPAYMSPEQMTAGRIPVDHRTDIYSLGATLYELLTLQPPFVGERRDQVLAQIMHKEPKAPRRINKKVPVDLETICLKALEKDPDRRYPTAAAMAEDLRRYVNRFAISARRAGPLERAKKWVRRRPAVAASLACLFVAVCVAIGFGYRAHFAEQRRLIEQERARVQLLDEKTRTAYLIASSGNRDRTEEAIKEIEALGASTGQVRLLRGLVAYFRQDVASAVSELEQAVKLLPESVAARALLAMSYGDAGQENYERFILEMARLSPSSPEDYLFKGYAREINELGGSGLADLDEGIQRRDSPLGRALRTIARTHRAIDSGRRVDAEAALADANAARGMLPDNPLALYASLYARLIAAGIYQEAHLPQERVAVLQEAARDVQALQPFIDLPNPAFGMWLYFDEIGEPAKALDVTRRSWDRSGSALAAFYHVVSLYQQARFSEALKFLDQRRQPDLGGDVMRLFLLAELPDGLRQALNDCQKFANAYRQGGWQMRTRSEILLFLGRKEEALGRLATVRSPFAISEEWKTFYEAMRQFDRGQLSADDYLSKAGLSRWKQFHAHYQIGLFQLAEGNRAGARHHFQEAVRTRAVWIYPWAWSKMFLSRLETDPAWPPWIPAKK